jgi:transcriptional regulator with XRE-family HTH domain
VNGQIHKLLKGRSKRPSLIELEKMATALGTNVDWLQFGRGDAPPARNEISPWPGPKKPIPRLARPKKARGLTRQA